uniref:Pseudouridine synthase RsuA/RluA-like domain-containing protein n=1 Tax=Alexandrium monilatum TaxID=311494 RepID=A0A6T0YZJ3_9DINO
MQQFACQGLANLSWALAALPFRDVPLLEAIAAAARPRIREFLLQGFSNMAWAFATLRFEHAPLFKAIASASIALLSGQAATEEEEERPAAAGCAALGGPRVLGLVHALALADLPGMEASRECLFAAAARRLLKHADALDARGLPRGCSEPTPGPPPSDGCAPEAPRVLGDWQHACVLWKPPGWAASVGFLDETSEEEDWRAGARARPLHEWLISRFGPTCPITWDEGAQHGLVHRLDRETSGPLLCAKSYRGYERLRLEFAACRVRKLYVCVCLGRAPRRPGALDAPLRVAGERRARRSAAGPRGQRARTDLRRVGHLHGPAAEPLSLVEVSLRTGRMHQIRAHLGSLGHPLASDALYGGGLEGTSRWPRLPLHAFELLTRAGGELLGARVALPEDLGRALATLSANERQSRHSLQSWGG